MIKTAHRNDMHPQKLDTFGGAYHFAEKGLFYSLKQIDFLSAYFLHFFRKEYIMKKETDF